MLGAERCWHWALVTHISVITIDIKCSLDSGTLVLLNYCVVVYVV